MKYVRPPRPVMRYHGGKYRLAPRILANFPPHRIYVEPFGGAGSVLLAKPRSFAEVYNDLNAEVVNAFRVLRDPAGAARLTELLRLTPWSRDEFELSYEPTHHPVESARRLITRAFMAFGSAGARRNMTGFRARNFKRNQTGAADWVTYRRAIPFFTDRLQAVTIENRDALDVIRQQDSDETLFYVDPPYPSHTRSSLSGHGRNGRAYVHDMQHDEDHRALAAVLHGVAGMVVLSGYACDLYDVELYPDWLRLELKTVADGGKPRTEVLWLNPAAAGRLTAPGSAAIVAAPGPALMAAE